MEVMELVWLSSHSNATYQLVQAQANPFLHLIFLPITTLPGKNLVKISVLIRGSTLKQTIQ